MKDETFKLLIDDYNILNTKLNTILNKLADIERALGIAILSNDAPKLTEEQLEDIKNKWNKHKNKKENRL